MSLEQLKQNRLEPFAKQIVFNMAWIGPCLVIMALLFSHNFTSLYRADAIDAAQVGRQISEGHGFSTDFIRPIAIKYQLPGGRFPELYQAPLYPLVLGLLFSFLPATDRTVALVSCVFFLLTIGLVFLLAKPMFGRRVAALCALLLGLNFALWSLALSGASTALWIFLTTLLLLVFNRHRGNLRASFGGGLLFGLSLLTEYTSIFLLLPFLWLAYKLGRERKGLHPLLFFAGCLMIFAPWGIRNYLLTGSPLFTLRAYSLAMFMAPVPGFTPTYPNFSVLREIGLADGSLMGFLLAHPREMGIKFLSGMLSLYNGIPVLFGIYALPFFIAGMLQRTDEARLRMMKGTAYLLLAFLIIGAALMTGAYELLSPLAPIVVILSGAVFWNMLQSRNFAPKAKGLAVGVLLLAAGIPAIANLLTPTLARKYTDVNMNQYLDRALPATAIVASDTPWDVAWYGKRTSIWLPNTANPKNDQPLDPTQMPEFAKIDGPEHRVKAIFLTSNLYSYPPIERLLVWQRIRFVPKAFKVSAKLPAGEVLLVRTPLEQTSSDVKDKHKP